MTEPTTARFQWTVPTDADAGHIPIAFDQRAVFGVARPAVEVDIAGYSYRSTIAIMRGETFVPLRRSHREAAGIAAGDVVAVTLTLDTAPRDVAIPDDLAGALADADLSDTWHRLSHSRRRELVEAIETAKRPDTRARRLAAAVDALRPR